MLATTRAGNGGNPGRGSVAAMLGALDQAARATARPRVLVIDPGSMVFLVFAHPYPDRSRANRRLLEAVEDLAGVEVRSLYDAYPSFDIDVPAEHASLSKADTVVWHHPTYWYTVPGLLKHWFDKVLLRGWAYGEGGTALRGKRCLWVTTTGGDDEAYRPEGMHGRPFEAYLPVVEQTALFCGMRWEEPLIVKGAHRVTDAELDELARLYRRRLSALIAGGGRP